MKPQLIGTINNNNKMKNYLNVQFFYLTTEIRYLQFLFAESVKVNILIT